MSEDALLRSLEQRPRDSSLRRVYADALEELGQTERAEFLRLQLRAAELESQLTRSAEGLGNAWLESVGVPSREHELRLASGRVVRLEDLRQWRTYRGLLEGLPNRELNARIIREASRGAEAEAILLLEPREVLIDEPNYRFGTPAQIPGIVCRARLSSFRPARDPARDYSALTVVWFQSDFAFPIAPAVLERLRVIDWDRHAADLEY